MAIALGEKRFRLTSKQQRRRQLALYVVGLLVLAYISTLTVRTHVQTERMQHAQVAYERDRARFERLSVMNCQANRENTIAFNSFIDKVVTIYFTSPVLSSTQRKARGEFLATGKQTVPNCPPLSKR